jgi:hypothetical protein
VAVAVQVAMQVAMQVAVRKQGLLIVKVVLEVVSADKKIVFARRLPTPAPLPHLQRVLRQDGSSSKLVSRRRAALTATVGLVVLGKRVLGRRRN